MSDHPIMVIWVFKTFFGYFCVYSGCGRNDVAEPNMTPMINEMKKYPEIFKYCDNFKDGNLYQMVYERGGHDINSVMRVMYNGLPKMFD